MLKALRRAFRLCVAGAFFALISARAMDLPHLDLDSLTFLSTDVVVADLNRTGGLAFSANFRVVATVRETLYGRLRPMDKLNQLSEFLRFFSPVLDGQRVVLFLDSRPNKPSFLSPEAAKSPFAVVPSGMYLIDQYEHVHEYSQQSNPGGYIAEGYEFGAPGVVPGRATDLTLPSLAEVKQSILKSHQSAEAVHRLLDRATVQDEPEMLALLDARYKAARCGYLISDAIAKRIEDLFQTFNDSELLVRVYPIAADAGYVLKFIRSNLSTGVDESRLKFLIRLMADRRAETPLRISAVEMLTYLGGFSAGPKAVGPADLDDNQWLAKFAVEINSLARSVFDDDSANIGLRVSCVKLLRRDKLEIISDMRVIHARTNSGRLRFAIEESLLDISDQLYWSLKPRGGPVSSIVSPPSVHDCLKTSTGKVAFVGRYEYTTKYSAAHTYRLFIPGKGYWSPERQYFLLTDASTGANVLRQDARGLGSGRESEAWTELDQITQLPAGSYNLTLQIEWNGSVVSAGYPFHLRVTETASGRTLSPAESQAF